MRNRDSEEGQDELRVTDRGRIYLDPEGKEQVNEKLETPNSKPKYVKETEVATQTTEMKVQHVQQRVNQWRKELQHETAETLQRLNRSADARATNENARFISD